MPAVRQRRSYEAIQSHSHTIAVPPEMLGAGEHFALEVRGDSMIEAGILDGDTVLIRKQDSAGTGEIVVALVDDEEATLKRLRRRGNSVALEAANPAYETRFPQINWEITPGNSSPLSDGSAAVLSLSAT